MSLLVSGKKKNHTWETWGQDWNLSPHFHSAYILYSPNIHVKVLMIWPLLRSAGSCNCQHPSNILNCSPSFQFPNCSMGYQSSKLWNWTICQKCQYPFPITCQTFIQQPKSLKIGVISSGMMSIIPSFLGLEDLWHSTFI